MSDQEDKIIASLLDDTANLEEIQDTDSQLDDSIDNESQAEEAQEVIEEPSTELQDEEEEEEVNLGPDSRVGVALYLATCAIGKVTPEGVLIPKALNMTQIAYQAEVNMPQALKSMQRLRKQGFMRNRKEDGRLLIMLDELTEWLQSEGASIE